MRHPEREEIQKIYTILKSEGLDLRHLMLTSVAGYSVRSSEIVKQQWRDALVLFHSQYPDHEETAHRIEIQSKGIMQYKNSDKVGAFVRDPFRMKAIEQTVGLRALSEQQTGNIIIGIRKNNIIAIGRLLDVEGSVELVSLWTHPDMRRMGIARKIIKVLITCAAEFPIYSFQTVAMIPFYLSEYRKYKSADVVPFDTLPPALQRDLYYMNVFWEPYTIIKIHS